MMVMNSPTSKTKNRQKAKRCFRSILFDAIIRFNNGKWAAIEIKLFDDEAIEKACKNLLKFKNNIISEKMKEPSFLMVITGTKNAYRREDGVFIVPIDCLKN